jgi:hypothetical protein
MVINMTSSEDGLKILRAWSTENTPCSISVAGNGFSLSAVGKLNISTSENEIELSWDGGNLGFNLSALVTENLLDLEILEGGAVQLRLPFEMFVLIYQTPDTQNKPVN